MSKINWGNKCWVTTIFLVNNHNKVLLTWNKNLQTWIPVGGHIDEGETPLEAIRREVKEETGFYFDFYGDSFRKGGVEIVKLHRFQIEEMPHHGYHMNFVFFGVCESYDSSIIETDEGEELRWFSKKEILKEEMLDSVRSSALAALSTINF